MQERREYTDEFKLAVVKSYLGAAHGLRVAARAHNLPSKNYITRWMQELLNKELLSPAECIIKSKSVLNKEKKAPYEPRFKTAQERQLERENERLRAEVAYLKKLQELEQAASEK